MVNSHTDCHAAGGNHMPGNWGSVAWFSLQPWGLLPHSWFPSALMDTHSMPPTALCPSPPKSWQGGKAEWGCSCPSVPVPHQHDCSGPGWPRSRYLSQHLTCDTSFGLLMTKTPWPGDIAWANHQDSHWWRTLATHQGKFCSCVSLG